LYFRMILGSLHLSQRALSGTGSDTVNHPNAASGMSSQSARWSLGSPSLKAKYPDLTSGIRLVGIKIPSMGFVPRLCVFGPWCLCCTRVILVSPVCWKVEAIDSSLMSLLISARMITISPSDCHSSICFFRSIKIWSRGHTFIFCRENHLTCCWYVVR